MDELKLRKLVDSYIDKMSFIEVYELGECVSVVSFNRTRSHFICAECCYVLINGNHVSSWLSEEAVDVMRNLPSPIEMNALVKKFKKMRVFT